MSKARPYSFIGIKTCVSNLKIIKMLEYIYERQ